LFFFLSWLKKKGCFCKIVLLRLVARKVPRFPRRVEKKRKVSASEAGKEKSERKKSKKRKAKRRFF
jgi:hypothetical protein